MRQLRFFFLFFSVVITQGFAADPSYLDNAEVSQFIDDFSQRHQYSKSSLIALIGEVRKQNEVLDAIQRPAEKKKNWQEYRKIFITSRRVSEGLRFWAENEEILQLAGQQYGIPPEIIVAIIGVESFYGKYEGRFLVLDSLVTLGFEYEPREKFFRGELEHFLLPAREEKLDPRSIKGSYAGAMGKSQFISSSYRRYAVDFDRDGKRDLWNSSADVIGSIANYFKEHGWKPNLAVAFPVTVIGERHKLLLTKGMKPTASISELPQYDVLLPGGLLADRDEVALLELRKDDSSEYWVGSNNFYVITRYNHSHMYAMAVYQLSQLIKQEFKDYVVQN